MESNESSCLHVKDIAFHAKNPNRAPPPHMSIFSLVKGGKEHEVFEMRMCGGGDLNSYEKKKIKGSQSPNEFKDWLPVASILKVFKLRYPFLLLQFPL